MRNRLIESRLTPNGISLTGLVLNVAAAAAYSMAQAAARKRPEAWAFRSRALGSEAAA